MAQTTLTVGIAQIAPRLGDVAHNLSAHEAGVREARGRGCDLVVFPELSLTGYRLRDLVPTVALRRDAPEIADLAAMSREIAVVAGLVEETADGRFFNAAFYFDRGRLVHVHRKVYLPTYGMFDEQRYFARGGELRAFDGRFGRMGLLVCEDLWHPSTINVAALDGALIVLCPSVSPLRGISENAPADDNARYWELLNGFYAQTFALFIVYANRVGFEDGVGFWGGSEIVDPTGERLAKARYYEPDFIAAEVDLRVVRRRRIAAPLLRDEDLDLTINELSRIRGRMPPAERAPRPAPVRVVKRDSATKRLRRRRAPAPARAPRRNARRR